MKTKVASARAACPPGVLQGVCALVLGSARPLLQASAITFSFTYPAFGQNIDLGKQGRNPNFSQMITLPNQTGLALPGSCVDGQTYFLTTGVDGKKLHGCSGGVWQLLGDGNDGQGVANYGAQFSGETQRTFTAAMHGNEHSNLIITCYDTTQSPARQVDGFTTLVNQTNNEVTLSFSAPFTGHCVMNGSGGGGGTGGSSGVASVFGRGGAVVAQPGDYDFADLGGALTPTQIDPSGRQGNGTKILMYGSGTAADGDCARFDAAGNVVSAGSPCGTGQGSGGVSGGTGILVTGTTQKVVSMDTAVVPSHLRAVFSHDFPAIAQGSCQQASFQMPGAQTGTTGMVSVNAPFPLGVNVQAVKVPTPGTVSVEICNWSGTSYDPVDGLTYSVTLFTVI